LLVAAPGKYFQQNRRLTEYYLEQLSEFKKTYAEIGAAVHEAKDIIGLLPHIKLIAVSDSAFFRAFNPAARHTSQVVSDFGRNGLATQSVLGKLRNLAGGVHNKLIICHLDTYSSVTAVKDGAGYDMDSEYCFHDDKLSPAQGTDVSKLFRLHNEGHKEAKRTIDHYIYSVRKSIGAYVAAMNGLDILVFSGSLGTGYAQVRKMVLEDLDSLNLYLDKAKNSSLKGGGFVNVHGKTGIAVIEADELGEIARQTITFN
jgi:acetate kinase